MRRLTDRFCAELSEGDSLELLTQSRSWFSTKGIEIVRYYFCDKNHSRDRSALKRQDYKRCVVCDQPLYRVDEDSVIASSDDSVIKIVKKKHLIFVDSSGNSYETCFGLNRCLTRVGHQQQTRGEFHLAFKPPTLIELASPEISSEDLPEYFKEAASIDYKNIVAPFIKEWVYKPIDKLNVSDFMKGLMNVEDKFLSLYCDRESFLLLRSKILKIIGVQR